MKTKINFLLSLILLGLVFPFQAAANINPDTTKIVILSLNDQHAKIDNYDKLKALVDKIRKENKHVLLFAAGDNFTGNPVVDMYPDKGYPIIELMNEVGFNAATLGNHEFDYGQEILLKRMMQAKFPYLSANVTDNTGKLKISPYKIFTLSDGIKIAVIGAIQLGSNGLPDSHPNNLQNISFTDGIQSIEKYKSLRDSCNIFIALTHLGFEADQQLAKLVPQIDLIMGGHTHTLTKPAFIENDVTIMQAGSGVKSLSMATILLVDGKVVKITPEMLNVSSFDKQDEAIAEKIKQYNDNKELNREIGYALSDILDKDELGSLMTDAILSLKNIDFAFQNNGGIRIDYLKKGPITLKDVYKLDPFGNEVILFKMRSDEIKSLIINAYKDSDNSIDLQVAGMKYTIITDEDGVAMDVIMETSKGKSLKNKKHYRVAVNSYIASSYKFDHKDQGRSLFKTTAQTLIDFLTIKKEVNYSGQKRAFKTVKALQ